MVQAAIQYLLDLLVKLHLKAALVHSNKVLRKGGYGHHVHC
jgi:hypothetical protein